MKVSGKQLRTALRANDLTQEQAAEKLGISRQTLNTWLSKAELNVETLQSVKDKLKIELTGYNLYVSSKSEQQEFANDANSTGFQNKDHRAIPMYNEPAAASAVEIYNDVREDQPAFFVNIPQFADCDFGKMLFGHSMHPTYENGSYLFMLKQSGRNILPGEAYYIETIDFKVVKRLQLGENDDELWAESDNEEVRPNGKRKYESFKLKKEEILRLYLVKGALMQNQN